MALSPGVDDGIVGDEVGKGIGIIFVVVGVMGVLVSFFETIEECLVRDASPRRAWVCMTAL